MPDERDQRWFPVRNGTQEIIPPFACLRFLADNSAGSTIIDGKEVLLVGKPNRRSEVSQDWEFHCFNGPLPIAPGGSGSATIDYPARVLIGEQTNVRRGDASRYALIANEWFISRERRVWYTMPAFTAVSSPQVTGPPRNRIKTAQFVPTPMHPPSPPLVIGIGHSGALTTEAEKIQLVKPFFNGQHRHFGWGYGWGYGDWNNWAYSNNGSGETPFGIALDEEYWLLRIEYPMTARIVLSGQVYINLPLAVEAEVGLATVDAFIQVYVNGETVDVTLSYIGISLDALNEIELKPGDILDVRAHATPAAVAEFGLDLRNIQLIIQPTFTEDEAAEAS